MTEPVSKITFVYASGSDKWTWITHDQTGRVIGRIHRPVSKIEHARRNAAAHLGCDIILTKQGGIYTGGLVIGRAIEVGISRA